MNKWIFLVITLLSQWTIEAQISDFETINFKNADKIAYSYKGNDLTNLPRLAYNLTNTLPSDVEKFRAIYTWVSTNIESDYLAFRKNHTKRSKLQNDSLELSKWNKSFSRQVFKKLTKEKKTICKMVFEFKIRRLDSERVKREESRIEVKVRRKLKSTKLEDSLCN